MLLVEEISTSKGTQRHSSKTYSKISSVTDHWRSCSINNGYEKPQPFGANRTPRTQSDFLIRSCSKRNTLPFNQPISLTSYPLPKTTPSKNVRLIGPPAVITKNRNSLKSLRVILTPLQPDRVCFLIRKHLSSPGLRVLEVSTPLIPLKVSNQFSSFESLATEFKCQQIPKIQVYYI